MRHRPTVVPNVGRFRSRISRVNYCHLHDTSNRYPEVLHGSEPRPRQNIPLSTALFMLTHRAVLKSVQRLPTQTFERIAAPVCACCRAIFTK